MTHKCSTNSRNANSKDTIFLKFWTQRFPALVINVWVGMKAHRGMLDFYYHDTNNSQIYGEIDKEPEKMVDLPPAFETQYQIFLERKRKTAEENDKKERLLREQKFNTKPIALVKLQQFNAERRRTASENSEKSNHGYSDSNLSWRNHRKTSEEEKIREVQIDGKVKRCRRKRPDRKKSSKNLHEQARSFEENLPLDKPENEENVDENETLEKRKRHRRKRSKKNLLPDDTVEKSKDQFVDPAILVSTKVTKQD